MTTHPEFLENMSHQQPDIGRALQMVQQAIHEQKWLAREAIIALQAAPESDQPMLLLGMQEEQGKLHDMRQTRNALRNTLGLNRRGEQVFIPRYSREIPTHTPFCNDY